MKYALLSVSDKTGLVPFASALLDAGFTLLSTGGTHKALRDAGLAVTEVSAHTGFPEMMDGRVKTLHPKIHGGLLQLRDHEGHQAAAAAHGIPPIDLVCVNLYPFEATVAKPGCTVEDAVENIDIGGPSMLRSAAKNHRFVTVVCDPADYDAVAAEIRAAGATTDATRRRLAVKVYAATSAYDRAIADWFGDAYGAENEAVGGETLRYGENPHQKAWLVRAKSKDGAPGAALLHGKEMSYNNYLDGDAAFETVSEFDDAPAAVVVKHGNPCGVATARALDEALHHAWEGDIVSAFGSVIALNRPVDRATAEFLKGKFVEALLAPSFEPDALEFLRAKSKDIRLLATGPVTPRRTGARQCRTVRGGVLVQTVDASPDEALRPVTAAALTAEDLALCRFAIRAGRHVKSNAIVIAGAHGAGGFMLLGMGAGQPNRVDSIRKLARPKAEENIRRLWPDRDAAEVLARAVLASDAFFPFADGVEEAAASGVKKIVQPGGSVRDAEVIAAADRLGLAMAFTGIRHFLH